MDRRMFRLAAVAATAAIGCMLLAGTANAESRRANGTIVKPPPGQEFAPDEFFIDLPQMMVSVPVDNKRARMLIIDLMLSTKRVEYRDYLMRVMPRVIDAIQVGVQNGTTGVYEAPDGMQVLKTNALVQVRKATNEQVIEDILVKNFRFY